MNATDRYKMLLATALERVCVLEEQLEIAQAKLAELNGHTAEASAETAEKGRV